MTVTDVLLERKNWIILCFIPYFFVILQVWKKTADRPKVFVWAILSCIGSLAWIPESCYWDIRFHYLRHLRRFDYSDIWYAPERMEYPLLIIGPVVSALILALQLRAIFTDRQAPGSSHSTSSGSRLLTTTRALLLRICGVSACLIWLAHLWPTILEPSLIWLYGKEPHDLDQILVYGRKARVLITSIRAIPTVAVLVVGSWLLLSRRRLSLHAAQYALVGWVLKLALFTSELVSLPHLLGQFESDISEWTRQAFWSCHLVSDLFLLAAVVADRGKPRAIVQTTDLLLEDPLFELRKLIRHLGLLAAGTTLISTLIYCSLFANSDQVWLIAVLWSLGIGFVMILKSLFMTYMMPDQMPNVIYLRSFRNDPKSYPVRVAIQTALGSKFRLTGIRDPRQRHVSAWSYVIGPALWSFRYCTPKYMDLEAGDDWQLRLWNSLQCGRMAIVDVMDLTPYVHVEIKLAVEALGFGRVLFLIDESMSREDWLKKIGEQTGEEVPDSIQTVTWRDDNLREFNNELKRFAASLPKSAPLRVLPKHDYGPANKVLWIERRSLGFLFVFGIFQFSIALLARLLQLTPTAQNSGASQLGTLFIWSEVGLAIWILLSLIAYAREVGVPYERQKAIIATLALVFFYAMVFVAISIR